MEPYVEEGCAIIDDSLYVVLGTADESGRPWATPVYFAHSGYRDFFWVSRPTARHSRNIELRDRIGLVVFDSHVPINTGRAVYMEARAREVGSAEHAAVLEIYSQRANSQGGTAVAEEDVVGEAVLRLYRATASAQYVLDEHDQRIPVTL